MQLSRQFKISIGNSIYFERLQSTPFLRVQTPSLNPRVTILRQRTFSTQGRETIKFIKNRPHLQATYFPGEAEILNACMATF